MNSGQPRVLVVDDDPAICHLLTTKLCASGFACESYTSGEEALQAISSDSFDAIISDLNMPGLSGMDLLEATRQRAAHTAFLMATGVSDVGVGVTAMKRGAADYLLKPFELEAVVLSLRRALEMKRLEAELAAYRQRLENMVDQRTEQLLLAMRRIERTYDETLEALAAALDLRDNETAGHSQRVTLYALEIAKHMSLSREQRKELERGAYLHDIGKIGIPDAILLKPAELTPQETKVMRAHARIGYELMRCVDFLSSAAQIVLTHQERYDGKGYPQGLAGEEIPLGARIFAVADTFDAILSDRPYRLARSYAEACAEIGGEAGKQFDPQVVAVFLAIPEESWLKIRAAVSRNRSAPRRALIESLRSGRSTDTAFPLDVAAQGL